MTMLCLDTAIFVLTLFKMFGLGHAVGRGLLQVFFRDGAIYYAILCMACVANILTLIGTHNVDSNRGLATTLTNALSTTLVSRIFINLRDPELRIRARRLGRWTLTLPTVSAPPESNTSEAIAHLRLEGVSTT
ncbi:hypothetical protein K466DRAFT_260166 [Polyporus arcularius HHB13444]|uniref:Uncharacterized protein n=1 Tax=Polyporus arcularius HHB13444 TaxID=1314778 RepID=A0A5C3PCA7_9APHY|nr:hypothetical protein K466DRAFT_260166 [Polyporus arcularius HHB13444]